MNDLMKRIEDLIGAAGRFDSTDMYEVLIDPLRKESYSEHSVRAAFWALVDRQRVSISKDWVISLRDGST